MFMEIIYKPSFTIYFISMKCIIITTINDVTDAIEKHITNKEYDVIIVGDKKTPNCYHDLDCIYLDLVKQEELFPTLYELLPFNHYCRKNLGYLYAIQNNYDIIYETDDDNIPYENFDEVLNVNKKYPLVENINSEWINIFKYFTNDFIWPRGYPLSLIKNDFTLKTTEDCDIKPSIINGLVDNDPDTDALFRLICNNDVNWQMDKSVIVSNKNMCVFNTQNTFWLNKQMFISLLIPCSVTFRYCDILRGIICNLFLRKMNLHMCYVSPNVIQLRNEHNLMEDFNSEVSMYQANESILECFEGIDYSLDNRSFIINIYERLLKYKIITELDMVIIKEWIKYF